MCTGPWNPDQKYDHWYMSNLANAVDPYASPDPRAATNAAAPPERPAAAETPSHADMAETDGAYRYVVVLDSRAKFAVVCVSETADEAFEAKSKMIGATGHAFNVERVPLVGLCQADRSVCFEGKEVKL